MFRYELIKIINKIYYYKYYPDTEKKEYGIVAISNSDRWIEKESKKDIKGYYAHQAMSKIKIGSTHGTIAWY